MPNGLFKFVFGRNQNDPGKPPVELFVHGSIKMRCLRRSCRTDAPNHWNIFNFFPHTIKENVAQINQAKPEEEEPISLGQAETSGIGEKTTN